MCYVPCCVGERPCVQLAHDPVRHSQDEGVPGGPRDVAGSHVSYRQGVSELTGPAPHLARQHGSEAHGGT